MADLPHLAGVDFRRFRGKADYPDFARIITASARGEGDDRVETPEGLASGYDHLERCDPPRDLLVAEVDGRAVGYSRVSTDHDAPEKVFEAWAGNRNEAATALIGAAGYEPVTYMAEMVRPSVDDLPDHPLPEGVEIRPAREEDLRAIWEAEMEAFRDHWGYVEPTEAGYERFLAFPYNDLSLWKIAWDDEGVAGQVKSFIDTAQNDEFDRKRGSTEAISTSRRWRRRGVAKALIVESIRELGDRGMTQVALGVHTENPNGAYDLYESLGYEVVSTWTTYRKPL